MGSISRRALLRGALGVAALGPSALVVACQQPAAPPAQSAPPTTAAQPTSPSGTSGTPAVSSTAPAGQGALAGQTITVPDHGDPNTVPVVSSWWTTKLEEFTKTTGVKVERRAGLDRDKYVAIFASADPSLDVIGIWAAWSAEFGAAGWLVAVDYLIDELGVNPDTDWVPVTFSAVTWAGKIYGLPNSLSPMQFFYNKTMFQEVGLDPAKPPVTGDEFIDFATKLTRGDVSGTIFRMQNPDDILIYFFTFLNAAGGRMYDDNFSPVMNEPEGKAALNFIVDLQKSGGLSPKSSSIVNFTDLQLEFGQKRTAMMFSWCIAWPMLRSDERVQLQPEEWDVALVPSVNPARVKSGTVDGSEGFGISTFSQKREAAGEYLKFWQSDQKQKEILLEAGWLPWSLKVLDDPQVQENGAARAFKEQSKYPMNRFGAPWYTEVQDVLGKNVMRAVQGQISVDEALDDTAARSKEIIDKHLKSS